MRICYILQSLNRIAPNTVIINLALNLVDKVEEIYVISLYKSKEDNFKQLLNANNIRFKEYDSQLDAFKDLSFLSILIQRFDILHLNQYKSNEIGNILHKYKTDLKVVSTCHSEEDCEAEALSFVGNAKTASIVRQREQQNFYKKHHRVFAVSRAVKEYLARIDCLNVDVIYSGIDYARFPSFKNKLGSKSIEFCQVGHLMPLKNQIYSLELIKFLKQKGLNVNLHFFGKDEYAEDYVRFLHSFISDNDLANNVVFHGEVSWKTLFEALQKMHLLLMPSITEGLPLALLEAFYFEVAAIVSKNGGMNEVVLEGVNGITVDVNNTHSEFERILALCTSKRYLEQGKQAREIALEKYTSHVMAQSYQAQYLRLLSDSN
ncbi:glycosyltransferase family 1 protein [Alteromonas sediminis]|uniref:Glycosyltransferase family 1 protein n=1 Tax=Alteromonas sediminis TaxID=2259342 RepID=A0A3N5YJT9_9ALTE|nr:glycosyltransferase family 4 protein [Alteromonas sediminis]RPJ64981.1 glycosyltransferase family 1 protein [Alteromonas sediminis]